jgi:hypothetical protein
MRSVFEEVGSVIIGGMVMLALLTLFTRIRETSFNLTLATAVQGESDNAADIINHELRAVGFNVPDSVYFLQTDSNAIKFLTDVGDEKGPDGVVDAITYSLGSPVKSRVTGQMESVLVRTCENMTTHAVTTTVLAQYVKKFSLRYTTATGVPTWSPASVKLVNVTLVAEDKDPDTRDTTVSAYNAGVVWQHTFMPNNLR